MPVERFSARSLISLPTMSAHVAAAFIRRLLAQFAKHKTALRKTRLAIAAKALAEKADTLDATLADEQARAASKLEAVKLDPTVDSTWAAVVTFLEAIGRLSWTAEGERATSILEGVFPDRLAFTQRRYEQQWSESNVRLTKLLAKDASGTTRASWIESQGPVGRLLLRELRSKHAAFGAALGLTEGTTTPKNADVRGALDAAMDAARDFVLATAALTERDVKNVESIRENLLFVIDEYAQPANNKKGEGATPTPSPAPTPTPAPST